MTLIENLQKDDDIEVTQEQINSTVPSIYTNKDECSSFKKSLLISTILHPTFFGLIALVLIILTLLGISLDIFKRPEPPKKDIEFVLVTKEASPINKNTKFRSDRNSRAGGKHDPKRPVSEPQASSPKTKSQSAASASKPPQKAQQQRPFWHIPKPQKQQASQPAPKAPAPSASRPRATAPRPTLNPKSTMQIPFPSAKDYKDIGPASGGPIAGTKSGATKGTASATSSAPTPSFSPSRSGGSSARSGSNASGSGARGNYGNPGPGNPMGAPGIDAIREPDFGPYMKELQRRIKMNWTPPKGNESKRVVLLFSISRDGRLLNVKVHKSSGLPAADNAAIHAVQLTAPFRPLPPEYKGSNVDIQFTFDYNVFGASRY